VLIAPPRAATAALALLGAAGCGGGGGGTPGEGPPTGLSYANPSPSYRVGVAAAPNAPSSGGGPVDTYSIAPDLPDGLTLDPGSGVLSGIPSESSPTTSYVVTATNTLGFTTAPLTVQVTPALPAGLLSLEAGFEAEVWLGSLTTPVKMAFAPDGRLFFTELTTGNVRVVDASGNLLATPFATLPVLTGGEQGLLGIALATDFSTSGNVFLYASTAAGGGHPDRNRVVRLTAVGGPSGNTGGSLTVIVDDLPIGAVHNAGNVAFGLDGMLYVSLGDVGDSSTSQDDASVAGRLLRYTAAGGIPGDNPVPGSPEWCRGLRNTYDFAIHPTTGGVFGSENGPTFGDEVNYLQKGKNFEWPSLPGGVGGAQVGYRVTGWTPVIAPTGVAFYTGGGFGPSHENNLFVGGYVDADLRRLVLSGAGYTDLDAEVLFATWDNTGGVTNKPLDVLEGPDGRLYVSTFGAIWRFTKSP
jgi:glucose/arabinose dehydrogenase